MIRKTLIFACIFGLFMMPMTAMATDSISPTTFTTIITVGGSASVDKTVSLGAGTPTGGKADVFFLADTTGSMGTAISSVKSGASAIMTTTSGYGDVAYGVGNYKDIYDSYTYRLDQSITTNTAAVQTGINSWAATGGDDTPEAQLYALYQVATSAATGWRSGSEKILIWFGDAPGHDPRAGVTETMATTALVNNGIMVEAISVGYNQLDSTGQATRITAATGGDFYSGIDQSALAAAIQDALDISFSTYSLVGLDLSEVPTGLLASYGGAQAGSWTRASARDFTFDDLTFTGLTPGTYDFNVYALVDGGRVATETEHIVVTGTSVPEPTTLLLLGLGLLGLAGARRKM